MLLACLPGLVGDDDHGHRRGAKEAKGNNAGCGANGKRDEEETITEVSRFGLDWIGYCGGAAVADVFSLKQRPRAASVEWQKRRRPFYPRSFVQLLLLLVDLMKEKRRKKIDRSRRRWRRKGCRGRGEETGGDDDDDRVVHRVHQQPLVVFFSWRVAIKLSVTAAGLRISGGAASLYC